MAVVIAGKSTDNVTCEATHPSGARVKTTAPKDNGGDGSLFSPTDLLATSLGVCTLTIIGIWAKKHGIDTTGASFTVEKHMTPQPPRRVARLPVTFRIPKTVPPERREAMEAAARACPVRLSLHPEVEVVETFVYE